MAKGEPLEQMWAVLVALVIAVFLVAGGTSAPVPLVRLLVTAVSLALIAASAWKLRNGLPSGLATGALVLVGLMWLLFAFQLIPLPAAVSLWFPGREAFRTAAESAGLQTAGALSLSPGLTRESWLATLPGVALFTAALSIEGRQRLLIAGVIVGLAIVAALLAVAQRFSGNDALFLYPHAAGDSASGFFANRNFLAAQLYTSIPLLGALALAAVKQQKLPGWLATLLGLAYLCIILGGLAAAASRTGIILSMAAIIATAFLPWGTLNSIRTKTSRRTLFYVAALFVFVFSQFGLAGLLRLVETDPIADYRLVIGRLSWTALQSFFPLGSGFGTFVPVFQMFETPAVLRGEYVNHAHNDWLEIGLEGGLPALFLLLAFLGWFGMACVRIWSRRSDAGGDLVMAASTVSAALLLLHSVVDYPLRTPALMALFGLSLGFAASAFMVRRVHHRPVSDRAPAPVASGVARKPFTPFKPARTEVETSKPGEPS